LFAKPLIAVVLIKPFIIVFVKPFIVVFIKPFIVVYSSGAPVILDLDGNGIEITTLNNSNSYFDFDDDTYVEKTAWTTDAILLTIICIIPLSALFVIANIVVKPFIIVFVKPFIVLFAKPLIAVVLIKASE
jgi:hypothetical protein